MAKSDGRFTEAVRDESGNLLDIPGVCPNIPHPENLSRSCGRLSELLLPIRACGLPCLGWRDHGADPTLQLRRRLNQALRVMSRDTCKLVSRRTEKECRWLT